ncbi:MAG: hypothetical protein ACRC76_11515 [Proteocatella sp.]
MEDIFTRTLHQIMPFLNLLFINFFVFIAVKVNLKSNKVALISAKYSLIIMIILVIAQLIMFLKAI